ncbi:hypothetical protein [Sodalis sp. dw_96]|uniref:hypothetical protein n=1 Tax=Sodalis sp. dw_96 TaxID=2719794 RepID=UPI001BD5085D|nr:hypothetical protein [Sodalis sp. dw_96]
MNGIHFSSAEGNFPTEGPEAETILNYSKVNGNVISTTNNSFEPYQAMRPPISNENIITLNEHKNLHNLSSDQGEIFGKYIKEDDYPFNLALPKKIHDSRYDTLGIMNTASHRGSYQKNRLNSSDVRHVNGIDRDAVTNRICAILIRACLPGSSCRWVALQHKISHQHFYHWCPKFYGKSINEMKEHLKLNIDNDKYKTSALSQLAAQVYLQRMSDNSTTKRTHSIKSKKSVITEVCKSDAYVKDTAAKYDITRATLYKWCESIYTVTLSQQRQFLRLNSPK